MKDDKLIGTFFDEKTGATYEVGMDRKYEVDEVVLEANKTSKFTKALFNFNLEDAFNEIKEPEFYSSHFILGDIFKERLEEKGYLDELLCRGREPTSLKMNQTVH